MLRHSSQHDKAHRRYLEHKRARLVRELRRVNEELRGCQAGDSPQERFVNSLRRIKNGKPDTWDFDPRSLEACRHA